MEPSPIILPGNLESFRVGRWDVHPDRNVIEGEGTSVRLEPRIMQVLVCLAQRPGEVISREQLIDLVWADTVVCEDALTKAVSDLRQSMGDDPISPRIIETIRKKGYRLIAPVETGTGAGSGAAGVPSGAPAASGRTRRIAWFAVAGIVIGLALIRWFAGPRERSAPHDYLNATPITSFPGIEEYPALSPDGTRLAFSWKGEGKDDFDVYVKQMNSEALLRLTDDPETEIHPVWSPDGTEVAFVRWGEEQGIYICSSLGGAARRLLRTDSSVYGIDWSPGGEWIACSMHDEDESPLHIALVSTETLEIRPLTEPESGTNGDRWPAFSPDGKTIAFARRDEALRTDIFLIPVAGGEARRVTENLIVQGGIDWSAGGDRIVFGAGLRNTTELWSVSVRTGDSRKIPTKQPAVHPTVSAANEDVVFSASTSNIGMALVDLAADGTAGIHRLTASTYSESQGQFSPDGKEILFVSDRSGDPEVWVSNSDGERVRQLTGFDEASIYNPRWSPAGGEIAFTATTNGTSSIYVMSEAGGNPRCLSTGDRHELFSCWSRDGRQLYFTAYSGGVPEVRRIGREGGESTPVVSPGQTAIGESADGTSLYYVHPTGLELWRVELGSGAASRVLDSEACADWTDPIIDEDGIYFVRLGEESTLSFYRFTDRTVESIAVLPDHAWGALSATPDRSRFLYNRRKEATGDLFLLTRNP